MQHHAHITRVCAIVIVAHAPTHCPCRVSNASLPGSGGGFWARFQKTPKGKDIDLVRDKQAQQAPMSLTRQRLLTIVFGDMETIRMVWTTVSE